jgi:hypothetical protein
MKKGNILSFLILMFLVTTVWNAYCMEKLTLKSGDIYSCNFVLRDNAKVVVLLFGYRVEIPVGDVKFLSFEKTEDELEVVLMDDTVIKGQIVEQDDDFYTIGTSAGLNTIEKGKIKVIRNPKYAEHYVVKALDDVKVQLGIVPSYTTILNSFGASYNTFWGAGLYVDVGLLRNFSLGLDLDFMMLSPQFGSTNETLFLLPVFVTFKYENAFGSSGDPLSKLYWYVKGGAGVSVDIFMEKEEVQTAVAFGISLAVSYGIRYALADGFSIGVGGKTQAIMESSAYALAQSAGVILELKF